MWASQVALEAKNMPANEGDIRNMGLIPLQEGIATQSLPFLLIESDGQKSLEGYNPEKAEKSWTRLKQLRMHVCTSY